MAKVVIYTKDTCPYCEHAKELLKHKGVAYTEIAVDKDQAQLENMMRLSNRRTVPQIFIDDKSIGGFDDLSALNASGELDKLLT
jgi:glutaredoxin 3